MRIFIFVFIVIFASCTKQEVPVKEEPIILRVMHTNTDGNIYWSNYVRL